MGRVDSHIHLFERGFVTEAGAILEGVAEYDSARAEAGIEQALVVGYEGETYAEGNNAYVRSLAWSRPWIRSLAYLPAARVPHAEELAALRSEGHIGVAVYAEEQARALRAWGPDLAAELAGAVVSVNARAATLGAERAWIESLAASTVLVSHLGLPGEVAADRMEEALAPILALAGVPHVMVKLSGLYAIDPRHPHTGARPVAERILDAFGPTRLAWGSDFSPVLGSVDLATALRFPSWWDDLSGDERALIDGGALAPVLERGWAR